MRERESYLNPSCTAVRNYTVVVNHPFKLQENSLANRSASWGWGRVLTDSFGSHGVCCLQDVLVWGNVKQTLHSLTLTLTQHPLTVFEFKFRDYAWRDCFFLCSIMWFPVLESSSWSVSRTTSALKFSDWKDLCAWTCPTKLPDFMMVFNLNLFICHLKNTLLNACCL